MTGKLALTLAMVAISITIADAGQCDDTIKCVGNGWNENDRYKDHPTDCTKYYRCEDGEPEIHTCPDGLWWTNNRQDCVDPKDSICKNNCGGEGGDSSEDITEESSEEETESPVVEPTEEPTEKPTDAPTEAPTDAPTEAPTDAPTETPTVKPEGPPTDGCDSSKCPGNNTAFLPNEDCGKFCVCDWGVAYRFNCDGNLHFNRMTNVCDWRWEAGCDAGTKSRM